MIISTVITRTAVITIMQVQEEMAAARVAVDNSEAAETQRTLIRAQAYATLTRGEMEGQSFIDFLCQPGVRPGEEPHESWIRCGGWSSEEILNHIQQRQEFSQSQLELLINY